MSIEFVLWVPVFMFFIVTSADASFVFMTHTQMWNAARESGRGMAVGAFTTEAEVEAYARQYLPGHATFNVTVDPDYGTDMMAVTISVDSEDAGVFGVVSAVTGNNMTATMIVRREGVGASGGGATGGGASASAGATGGETAL